MQDVGRLVDVLDGQLDRGHDPVADLALLRPDRVHREESGEVDVRPLVAAVGLGEAVEAAEAEDGHDPKQPDNTVAVPHHEHHFFLEDMTVTS